MFCRYEEWNKRNVVHLNNVKKCGLVVATRKKEQHLTPRNLVLVLHMLIDFLKEPTFFM